MPLDQATDWGVPTGTTRGDCEPGPQTRFEGLPASEFLRTGRWMPPQLPIVSEEAEVRVSDVVRAQDQAGGGDGGPCVAHARALS